MLISFYCFSERRADCEHGAKAEVSKKKKDRPCKRGTAAAVKRRKVLCELLGYFDNYNKFKHNVKRQFFEYYFIVSKTTLHSSPLLSPSQNTSQTRKINEYLT